MNIPNLPNLPLDNNGWSVLKESDTKKYYVSVNGNDNNDGLSPDKPLKTLKAGISKLRNNSADWLLLKSGDVWDESAQIWGKNGKSPLERIIITSYGGNVRPVISQVNSTGEGIRIAKCQNLAVVGIHVRAGNKDPKNPSYDKKAKRYHGISIGEANTHNILIEDCYAELYETNILCVYVTEKLADFNNNIVIRRNVLTDAWSNGGKAMNLYASGMVNLTIEENVFDRGGHVPEFKDSVQTGFSHNIYMSTHNGVSYIYRNILARPASHGAQQRAGGLMQDNLSINCAHHYLIGLGESETAYNVGIGCINLPTTKMGFGVEIKSTTSANVHHNLFANKQNGVGGWPALKFTFNSTDGFVGGTTIPLTHNADIKVHDNVAYQWNSNEGVCVMGLIDDSTLVCNNNKLFQTNFVNSLIYNATTANAKVTFKDNQYTTDQPLNSFAKFNNAKISFDDWKTKTGDNSTVTALTFTDATRTIEKYAQNFGLQPTIDALMSAAKQQSRSNWKQGLRATVINDYFRAGFGLPQLNATPSPEVIVTKPTIDKIWLRDVKTKGNITELKNGDKLILSNLPIIFNIKAQTQNATAVRMVLDGTSILEKNEPYCYPGDDVALSLKDGSHTLVLTAYGNEDGKTNPSDTVTIAFTSQAKPNPKINQVTITDTNGGVQVIGAGIGINKVTITYQDGSTKEIAL